MKTAVFVTSENKKPAFRGRFCRRKSRFSTSEHTIVIFVTRAKRVCLFEDPEVLEAEALAEAKRSGAEKRHLSLELRR